MAQGIPQADLHRRLTGLHAGLVEYVSHLDEALRPDQRAWPPPRGGWAIDLVFEHLCLSTGSYLEAMTRTIERAGPAPAGDWVWRPTLAGRFLVWAFRAPRPLPAPRRWVPAGPPRPEVLPAFAALLDRLRDLMDEAAGLPWRRHRFRSPASRLVRVNLGDGFAILVTHTERHLRQVDRITRSPGFPR